jgi:hypothetical protein
MSDTGYFNNDEKSYVPPCVLYCVYCGASFSLILNLREHSKAGLRFQQHHTL